MTDWYRQIPFCAEHGSQWNERWEYRPNGIALHSFEVLVEAGKPLDILALKGSDLKEIRQYSDFLKRTARHVYADRCDDQPPPGCPICSEKLDRAVELTVFDIPYVRCGRCGHGSVARPPERKVLDKLFAESENHSSPYIDQRALEIRMAQIIVPKIEWCKNIFRRQIGRTPGAVIDVGAGGGHFLAGALRTGMTIEGFELSGASRNFARDAFGINLRKDDFLTAACASADLITFWGLLEYVLQPRDFVAAAKRKLSPEGMLVIEVPRFDALGTLVQAMHGSVVARHMDPTSHINAFTDESLCTLLVEEGFAPVAAWYFGMDAYELCVQMALKGDGNCSFAAMTEFIPVVQQALDRGRQCDDIIIAAVPLDCP